MSTTALPTAARPGAAPLPRLRRLARGRAGDPAWVRPAGLRAVAAHGDPGRARGRGVRPVRAAATFAVAASAAARAGGGMGALSATTIAWLQAHRGTAKYLVAATASQTTAGIIIATGEPVVTIGGFNGGDPAPTVAQFASMVARGELRSVLLTGGGGPAGSSSAGLTAWVQAHGTAVTGAGVTSGTLYRVAA